MEFNPGLSNSPITDSPINEEPPSLTGSYILVEEETVVKEIPWDNVPKTSTWWATPGEGSSLLGQLASGYNTVKEIAVGSLFPYSYTPSEDPLSLARQQRVANGGRQLKSGDLKYYIDGLRTKTTFNAVHSLYMQSTCIQAKTLDQVKASILDEMQHFEHPDSPIVVIPVGYTSGGYWEWGHIAVIVIKDNCVEYYDAQGVRSIKKELFEKSGTVRDILEFCRDTFTQNGAITENPFVHQFDVHNCVVFVCRHLDDRLLNFGVMGAFGRDAPSLQEVGSFREEIIKMSSFSPY